MISGVSFKGLSHGVYCIDCSLHNLLKWTW